MTDLITVQRAYEANTKVVTTSDEILQDLINMKR
jgi:flagellar hook protein FlgE